VPLSFDWDGEMLLPPIATTNVYNRLNVPTRQVAGAWGWSSSEEVPLNWNKWVRQIHRWLSIVFTVTVIICFASLGGSPPFWVFYVPLLPLALLLFTGLYLFVLPYATKGRSGRRTALET
jgi:cellulose synthase/poly-beta-1,6-N-acetylglucosamine synthase-like glycosyltransferase